MSIDDWERALEILGDQLKPTFFLFLGTEPLLLRHGFVRLVRRVNRLGVPAAWYTTSPEPHFTDYREALIAAGVDNWSSGVDTVPGLPFQEKKAFDAIAGLEFMASRGVNTHVTTTVHRKNLVHIPYIMEWVYDHIPGVEYAVNFLHWSRGADFDFSSRRSDMPELAWDGTLEEQALVKSVMREVWERSQGRKFHTSQDYVLQAHYFYNSLNLRCRATIGPSVDTDGTMRLCGYSRGGDVRNYNVLELANSELRDGFLKAWKADVWACIGCYWGCFRLPKESMLGQMQRNALM